MIGEPANQFGETEAFKLFAPDDATVHRLGADPAEMRKMAGEFLNAAGERCTVALALRYAVANLIALDALIAEVHGKGFDLVDHFDDLRACTEEAIRANRASLLPRIADLTCEGRG